MTEPKKKPGSKPKQKLDDLVTDPNAPPEAGPALAPTDPSPGVGTAADAAIEATLAASRKRGGGLTVMSALDALPEPKCWTPCPVLAFQACVGDRRGIPSGRVIEIQGWESAGKSTLLDQILAGYQRQQAVAGLAETEQSRQKAYSERLGIDKDKLLIFKDNTVEGISEEMVATLIHLRDSGYRGPIGLGWDTIANTPSRDEVDVFIKRALAGKDQVDEVAMAGKKDRKDKRPHAGPALAARALNEFFRVGVQILNESLCTLYVVNQFYAKIGATAFEKQTETYGGKAMKYGTSARIEVRRIGNYKDGAGNIRGHYGAMVGHKNKIRAPRVEIPFLLVYGYGFDNTFTVCRVLQDAGIFEAGNTETKFESWSFTGLSGLRKLAAAEPPFWEAAVKVFWDQIEAANQGQGAPTGGL